MMNSTSISERVCVEACLKMCFLREPHAPPFVVISPKTWKAHCGLQLQGTHALNKAVSIKRFKCMVGEEVFDSFKRLNQNKMDV